MTEDKVQTNTQVLFGAQAEGADELEYAHRTAAAIGRYVVAIMLARGVHEAGALAWRAHAAGAGLRARDAAAALRDNHRHLIVLACIALALVLLRERVLGDDFPLLVVGYMLTRYIFMEREKAPTINYGVGMACSFFEGYLAHVIPSDGAKFVGFQENIRVFEGRQGVCFPVKRLFIVIPGAGSLYCPPDLQDCNAPHRDDLPYLEAINSLEDIMKDVAGVKNRLYRNSAYKIHRRGGRPPVYLCAEFASPLHTLHRVLDKRFIYDKLCDVDVSELVEDFVQQLARTIARSPDCRGKCELVRYDASTQNLADVLLDKVRELEPRFEEIIQRNSELQAAAPAPADK